MGQDSLNIEDVEANFKRIEEELIMGLQHSIKYYTYSKDLKQKYSNRQRELVCDGNHEVYERKRKQYITFKINTLTHFIENLLLNNVRIIGGSDRSIVENLYDQAYNIRDEEELGIFFDRADVRLKRLNSPEKWLIKKLRTLKLNFENQTPPQKIEDSRKTIIHLVRFIFRGLTWDNYIRAL